MSTALHVSGKHNLTFIHIPKTAGTSIGEWLLNKVVNDENTKIVNYDGHETLDMILADNVKNYTIVSVRNPWARIYSLYCYASKETSPFPNTKLWIDYYHKTTNKELTFSNFLENLSEIKARPTWWFTMDRPQTDWIKGGADLIIKFESLEEDFKKVREMFDDFTTPLQTHHMYDYPNYRDYYTTETKNLIEKVFEEDIDTFKYTF